MSTPVNPDTLAAKDRLPRWRILVSYTAAQFGGTIVAGFIAALVHHILFGRESVALSTNIYSDKLIASVAVSVSTFVLFLVQARRSPQDYWLVGALVGLCACTVDMIPMLLIQDPGAPPWFYRFGARLLMTAAMWALAGILWRPRVRGV